MGAFFSHSRSPSENTQTMEESQPLSTNEISTNESFSYKWLMNMNMKQPVKYVDYPKNTLGFFLDLEGDHSRESMKCVDRSSFHFDIPPSSGPTDMSVADQMICNGSLVPLNLINERNKEIENNAIPENSIMFRPLRSFSTQYRHVEPKHPVITPHSSPLIYSPTNISRASNNGNILRDARRKPCSFERSKKPPKRIVMLNYFKSLMRFCKKVKGFGLVDEVRPVSPKASNNSLFQSQSGCSSPLYDVGRERAISEAILYCKSSSRKYAEGFEVDQDKGTHK